MCFHTPTVRRAAHSIADGYETRINGTAEGNHIENIYGDDVTITIYGLVPDYVVGRSTSRR